MVIKYLPNVENELSHHGIKGMKWGVRRYQNPDGTLTDAGRKRYSDAKNDAQTTSKAAGGLKSIVKTIAKPVSIIGNVAGTVEGGLYGAAISSAYGLGATQAGAAIVGGVLGGALGSVAVMAASTGIVYAGAHIVQKYANHKVEKYNKKLS